MKRMMWLSLALVSIVTMRPLAAGDDARPVQAPKVEIPKPGVSQIMTIEGTWVRAAYNNEGYVVLGYRLANMSVGEEWMLLEIGATVRDGVPYTKLTRESITLDTPDGKTIPLASVMDYRAANLSALQAREKVVRDSINYFPPGATDACRIGFFSELSSTAVAYDEVELSSRRGCVGRVFFKVPGGIQYGQHWLNVQFDKSLVRAPFRILTKDEEKMLDKNYKDIRKQVQEAFKPPKKEKK